MTPSLTSNARFLAGVFTSSESNHPLVSRSIKPTDHGVADLERHVRVEGADHPSPRGDVLACVRLDQVVISLAPADLELRRGAHSLRVVRYDLPDLDGVERGEARIDHAEQELEVFLCQRCGYLKKPRSCRGLILKGPVAS